MIEILFGILGVDIPIIDNEHKVCDIVYMNWAKGKKNYIV